MTWKPNGVEPEYMHRVSPGGRCVSRGRTPASQLSAILTQGRPVRAPLSVLGKAPGGGCSRPAATSSSSRSCAPPPAFLWRLPSIAPSHPPKRGWHRLAIGTRLTSGLDDRGLVPLHIRYRATLRPVLHDARGPAVDARGLVVVEGAGADGGAEEGQGFLHLPKFARET